MCKICVLWRQHVRNFQLTEERHIEMPGLQGLAFRRLKALKPHFD